MIHAPRFARAAATALALVLAGGIAAAQTTTPTPAPRPAEAPGAATGAAPAADAAATPPVAGTDLSLGEPVPDDEAPIGTPYIAEEHGDWDLRCFKSELTSDPCELYQLLQDQTGNSVAEINLIGLAPGTGGEAVAGASVVTPLETYLPAQLTIRVDSGQAKRYPFTTCAAYGCIARIGLTEAEVAAFRRGNKATIIIVPALAPDQQVAIDVSLRGFTAGYEAVNAANAAAEAAARAAEAAAPAGDAPAAPAAPAPAP